MSTEEVVLYSDRPPKGETTPSKKPIIVGLYGIPGAGKSYLLNKLKDELGNESFLFFEGTEVIASVCPGGLDNFNKLSEGKKTHWRGVAILTIQKTCFQQGKDAVVIGHFVFWPESEPVGHSVWTPEDLQTYTHILYMRTPAKQIAEYRAKENTQRRLKASVEHLDKWQTAEYRQLRNLCLEHGIFFMALNPHLLFPGKVAAVIRDFQIHTEPHNMAIAKARLDEIMSKKSFQIETVLLLDADRTLTSQDCGRLYWEKALPHIRRGNGPTPLTRIFSGPLGYSYAAFRQASMLFAAGNDHDYDMLCSEVAGSIVVYPEFLHLLHRAVETPHIKAIIVTCGLRRVWTKVLEREGLLESVDVIGGGPLGDGMVVTAAVKGGLVDRLHETTAACVWAFGDSPLDIEMLKSADKAVVVTGLEHERSKSMDKVLKTALDKNELTVHQVLLPSDVPPRDPARIPLVNLSSALTLKAIFSRRFEVHHATEKNAAKVLVTRMRDSSVMGPALRDAHWEAGKYLALQYVSEIIGVEEVQIQHVQGHTIAGHRLLHEEKTLIMALMRGGEAMALGISSVFPLASFVHASDPTKLEENDLRGRKTVLLVDSVVNSGKTVFAFMKAIQNIDKFIRIVVVAGVIYEPTVSGQNIARNLGFFPSASFVALRLSKNQFLAVAQLTLGIAFSTHCI
jgi:uracil phosphoribosyltransferase/phosphoserine phosphatase